MMEMNVDRYPDVVDVKQFSPVDEKACEPSFRSLAMEGGGRGRGRGRPYRRLQ
jgi:hypothetical protein